ncbi:hypothetical protein [Methylobacterium dankookense]|uniref:Uncharacterized protein n=1 Tax=Methylobacterium dankookense TaxID=560405 RepID=A0A564G694_9HYPH|nr:hypothetical protein [Methylobacterium dankookense]GJD55780.1 hypothetical protein IFDJLNFL_1667 [Methylobacterium dankookense]VUF15857.1 hypothetical protein MTDSW087_05605 [Methylobacterium dankookense]
MMTEGEDAAITEVATVAALRAIINHFVERDWRTFTEIHAALPATVGELVSEEYPSFREKVLARAEHLYFTRR